MYYTILYLVNNNEICYTYDTYGKLTYRTGTTVTPFMYNGRDGVMTDENGLYYMRARYYHPEIKRFINADIVAGNISDAVTLNRFAYANCNPVSFVDPFGLSPERGQGPTVLEAAYMAELIYHINNNNQEHSINNWEFSHLLIDDRGFRIGIYKKVSGGVEEYAVVNKGSTTFNDWVDNILQPIGLSSDMKTSISYIKEFVNEHPDAHITFIGHSKGGAEAAANAVATNCNAILFNPATVNLNAYNLSHDNYDANMTAYIVDGEILNSIFAPISKNIDDIQKIGKESIGEKLSKLTSVGRIFDIPDSIGSHSMETVIFSLIAEGHKLN